MFWRLKNTGHIMLGISSYENYPAEITNPIDNRHVGKDPDIYAHMDGWLHCQRDPGSPGLPPGVPRALISESDFTNPMRNDGGGILQLENIPKQYDFLYVNQVRQKQRGTHTHTHTHTQGVGREADTGRGRETSPFLVYLSVLSSPPA